MDMKVAEWAANEAGGVGEVGVEKGVAEVGVEKAVVAVAARVALVLTVAVLAEPVEPSSSLPHWGCCH